MTQKNEEEIDYDDEFGDFEPLGEKADASVNFTQPLLAIQVVAVLGSVAIACGPVHGFHHLWPLVVHQAEQFSLQSRIACWRQVIFAVP